MDDELRARLRQFLDAIAANLTSALLLYVGAVALNLVRRPSAWQVVGLLVVVGVSAAAVSASVQATLEGHEGPGRPPLVRAVLSGIGGGLFVVAFYGALIVGVLRLF